MDARHATRRRFLKEGVTLVGVAVGAGSVRAQIDGSAEPVPVEVLVSTRVQDSHEGRGTHGHIASR